MPLLDAWSVLKRFEGFGSYEQAATGDAYSNMHGTQQSGAVKGKQGFQSASPYVQAGTPHAQSLYQPPQPPQPPQPQGQVGVVNNDNTAMLAQAYRNRQNNLAAEQEQTNQMMAAPNQQYQMMQMNNQSIHDRMSGR